MWHLDKIKALIDTQYWIIGQTMHILATNVLLMNANALNVAALILKRKT